jgi:hypothetical protein
MANHAGKVRYDQCMWWSGLGFLRSLKAGLLLKLEVLLTIESYVLTGIVFVFFFSAKKPSFESLKVCLFFLSLLFNSCCYFGL